MCAISASFLVCLVLFMSSFFSFLPLSRSNSAFHCYTRLPVERPCILSIFFLGSLFWIPTIPFHRPFSYHDACISLHHCYVNWHLCSELIIFQHHTCSQRAGFSWTFICKTFYCTCVFPCVIDRGHLQGFCGFLFFLMAIFLGIPSRALWLECCSGSRFNNMSFCSNIQMTSKQRVHK